MKVTSLRQQTGSFLSAIIAVQNYLLHTLLLISSFPEQINSTLSNIGF
jgi:hypothetical protein